MAAACGRCSGTVYKAEEIAALGRSWHPACFTCSTCAKKLQQGEAMGHDAMPYCQRCHSLRWGSTSTGNTVSGEGRAEGVIDTQTSRPDFADPLKQKQASASERSGAAESVIADRSRMTEAQLAAERNRNALKAIEKNQDEEDDEMDLSDDDAAPSLAKPAKTGFVPPKKVSVVGGVTCLKCGKGVGFAEKIVAIGGAWHKGTCFTCHVCNKAMASASESLSGGDPPQPVCKLCHAAKYGKKIGI